MPGFLSLTQFVPAWVLPWVALIALAAWVLGFGRAAFSLGLFLFMTTMGPQLLGSWLSQQSMPVRFAVGILTNLLLLHGLITLLFGHGAAGQFTGTWLVRIFDWIVIGPLRGLRMLFMRHWP